MKRGDSEIIMVPLAMSEHATTEDFTRVFLGHARLYVLAEKYGVEH